MDITKLVNVDDLLDKDIFELLGIENAGEDRKEEIFNRMIQTVNMRVATRIASMLTQEEATKFQDLAESGNADALAEFLTVNPADMIVVFDGKNNPSKQRGKEVKHGIKIFYSAQGETADEYIMEMIEKRTGKAKTHLIVSSDREITNFATKHFYVNAARLLVCL